MPLNLKQLSCNSAMRMDFLSKPLSVFLGAKGDPVSYHEVIGKLFLLDFLNGRGLFL